MAWTKIVLADQLLDSDLPDDPFLRTDLFDEAHLTMPYHSVNTDVGKRIRYLD